MPVHLYWGEEEFNIDNAVQKLRAQVLDENWAGMNHKCLNEPDMQTLVETLETTPMMFGNLLIEINSTNLFLRGGQKTNVDDKLNKRLVNILETLNENLHVLFVCKIPRGTNKKIDSVKKLVKTISKVGKVQEFSAFKTYEENKITAWIKESASSKQLKITNDAALCLLHHTGPELRKLDSELEKLKLSIYPNKSIQKQHINELCSDHENIFLMTDYWITNKKPEAVNELNKLLDKNHPVRIIATMQSLLKRWLRIKVESKKKSAFEISKIIKLHEFVVKKDIEKLNRISVDQIIKLRNILNEAEYNMKTGKLTPELSIEMAIVQ